jgi:hypothetical protein
MNIPENNKNFLHEIAIALLGVSIEFKSILQSSFPDIYADIESASTNPNCTCVKKVKNKMLENGNQLLNILNTFLSDKDGEEKIENIVKYNYSEQVFLSIRGKMFVIENTPEKYEEFMDDILKKRLVFRNFSTAIDSDNNLFLYFV